MAMTPSMVTDIRCCCTINTCRRGRQEQDAVGSMRKAIEDKIRITERHANWRCVKVIKDS